jgi:D-serine deaminase-like pyridoxal phosphate-dependent protein
MNRRVNHMNRRSLIMTFSSALGASLLSDSRALESSADDAQRKARPETKSDIPTPALLVDLDQLDANIAKLAEHCRTTGCAARPHAKTHKCPEIARRQVAAGARGIACATVPEAEAMVAAGLPGVLLTSPIVDTGKVARMIGLIKRDNGVMLAVGHPREANLVAEAAEAHSVIANVLVDLDVGDQRFGILPGKPALELAQLLSRSKWVRVRGVQAYSGKSTHVIGFDERKKASQAAMAKAVETRELLARDGFDTAILSGGSTGTYNIDTDLPGGIELQSGSYVFMDNGYRDIGSRGGNPVYADFPPSLTVLATVVSATHADRVSVDAGLKAFATDSGGTPRAKAWDGLEYKFFGDEFGLLTAKPGANLPKIGDRLEFYVTHCDPTVNLYDRMYAVRGDRVEAIWPIVARRG